MRFVLAEHRVRGDLRIAAEDGLNDDGAFNAQSRYVVSRYDALLSEVVGLANYEAAVITHVELSLLWGAIEQAASRSLRGLPSLAERSFVSAVSG